VNKLSFRRRLGCASRLSGSQSTCQQGEREYEHFELQKLMTPNEE